MNTDIPRELQYLITSYNHDAIFSLPFEHLWTLNWNNLLRDNFGYEGLSDISTIDLICLYIDRCQKKKYVFCGTHNLYVRIGNTLKRGRSGGLISAYPLPDRMTSDIEDIVCDHDMIFVKYNNSLMVLGRNEYGQLGIGNLIPQKEFVEIKLEKIHQIARGSDHTIILMEDRTVMGSGSNIRGELGLDASILITNQFKKIRVDNVKKIVGDGYSTFFLLKNGKLLKCGCNVHHRMNGKVYQELNEIMDLPGKVIDIAGSHENMLLLLANGTLMASGINLDGQLGLGDRAVHDTYKIVQGVPRNISKIFIKDGTSVIQLSDGTLMGAGFHRTLGFSTTHTLKFKIIPGIPKNIKYFRRTLETLVILLTDDKIIEIGTKIVFDT